MGVQVQVSDIVSLIEVTNCKKVTIFVAGNVPSIQIDKSESPRVTVLHKNKCPEMIISQVTAGNVEMWTNEDNDTKEFPMPEQFKLMVSDDKESLSCKPTSH